MSLELLGTVAHKLTLLSSCKDASDVAHKSFIEGVVDAGALEARKLLAKAYKHLQKCSVSPVVLEGVAKLIQAVETRITAAALEADGATVTTTVEKSDGGGGGASIDGVVDMQPIEIGDELVKCYNELLQSDSVQDIDMGCDTVDAINHYYGSEIAANPVDARTGRAKMRRLGKECKGLREVSALPCRT